MQQIIDSLLFWAVSALIGGAIARAIRKRRSIMKRPKAKATCIRHGDHYHAMVIERPGDGSRITHQDTIKHKTKADALKQSRAWRMDILTAAKGET